MENKVNKPVNLKPDNFAYGLAIFAYGFACWGLGMACQRLIYAIAGII